MKFNTKLLHGGFEPEKTTGSTLTPIYQVSAFAQESAEQLEKVFNNKAPGYAYTRISNPTVAAFENRMNTLEKGVGAVACSRTLLRGRSIPDGRRRRGGPLPVR